MLKITVQKDDRRESRSLILEGRLSGPWVEELERFWLGMKDSSTGSLVIDLTGVTFIEQEGKLLLGKMWQEGAEFVAAGCCSRSIVEEITSSVQQIPSKSV